MLEYNMDPQEALDVPRFCIGPGHAGHSGAVSVEEGISEETISELQSMGHAINGPLTGYSRALFGRGQIIRSQPVSVVCGDDNREEDVNVWWAGSDGRADGMALGY